MHLRSTPLLVAVLVALAMPTSAEEAKHPFRIKLEEAADAVAKAHANGDGRALKQMAVSDQDGGVDAWLIAEVLSEQGHVDAALALAQAGTHVDVQHLGRYVRARRGIEPAVLADVLDRQRRLPMRTFLSHKLSEEERAKALATLTTTEGLGEDALRTVPGIRLLHQRARVLAMLRRPEESQLAFRRAVDAARALGWTWRVSILLHEFGHAMALCEEARKAAAVWEERTEFDGGTRRDLLRRARTRGNLGIIYRKLGQFDRARDVLQPLIDRFDEHEDRAVLARAHNSLGVVSYEQARYDEAREHYRSAARIHEEDGRVVGAADAVSNVGDVLFVQGRWKEAATAYDRAEGLFQQGGARHATARLHNARGNLAMARGEYDAAQEHFEQSKALRTQWGHRVEVVHASMNLAQLAMNRGYDLEALHLLRGAERDARDLGRRTLLVAVLRAMGSAYDGLGRYGMARTYFERALAEARALGMPRIEAHAIGNLGLVDLDLGAYASAAERLEASRRIKERIGDRLGLSRSWNNVALLHGETGDPEAAVRCLERAVELKRDLGARVGEALAMGNLGTMLGRLGRRADARTAHERVVEIVDAVGADRLAAAARYNLAAMALEDRDFEAAIEWVEDARAGFEAIGSKPGVADTQSLHGEILCTAAGHRGEGHAQGIALLRGAVDALRYMRATPKLVVAYGRMARMHLAAGEHAQALERARDGRRELEEMLGGLAEEEGASMRSRYVGLFEAGTVAALHLGRQDAALSFLEAGRAGTLLESLGGRRALRWTDLPEGLAQELAESQEAESRARAAHARAVRRGRLERIREAEADLDEARDRRRAAMARVQRDAKKQAGLFYPRPAPRDDIQGSLAAGEVLVVYGLFETKAVALVVTPSSIRHVDLGSRATLDLACEALRPDAADVPWKNAVADLRKRVVAPLALPKEAKRVLVSPAGRLGLVPMALIFDRPVALVPSASTHVLLRANEVEKGTGILAFADPDYTGHSEGAQAMYARGRALGRLEHSRQEAAAITAKPYLGGAAKEAALPAAVARQARWRAIHFACHGLIDPDRPTLSSLALTAGDGEDGYLTVGEILRMELPADLAVLSACETGVGKVQTGEGIVGFTRAFMYAGAPRVLCSLWKVDDEATKELMTRFYAHWNPKEGKGRGAAEALRAAQEEIRKDERWAHPYYWGAWVLWGLPD